MIFDIAAVVFVVVFSFIMAKRGGVTALVSLFGFVLSVVLAYMLYPVVSDAVYSTPLPDNLEAIVYDVISLSDAKSAIEVSEALPEFVGKSIALMPDESLEAAIKTTAGAVTRLIVDVVVFIVLIIVTKLLIKLLVSLLDLTMKLPVLRQINAVTGLVCGVAISLVIVYLAVALTGVLAASNTTVASWIEGSKVVLLMSNITPF